MKFYVYEFWDMRSNSPFYVGKGSSSRCLTTGSRNEAVEERIKQLNHRHEIRIVLRTELEHEAFDFEKALIEKYGSKILGTGPLLNIASLPPIQRTSQQESVKTTKNYKSSWHLARSGGTKQEIEELKLEELRRVAEEIERNPMWAIGENGKLKYNL